MKKVNIFVYLLKEFFMSYYIPNPEGFKHYSYGKYKIDFYKNTAIISWKRKVDEDYDEITSYKSTKTAILDRLRDNSILSAKFILLQEISPAEYTQLPPEKEVFELYIQFKENLTAREKKEKIKQFIDNLLFEN